MTWNMKAHTWEDVGIMQKWFATGEAIAHLQLLEEKGAVASEDRGDTAFFSST